MMNFKHALISFSGRLRRRDWWLWSIALSVTQFLTAEIANHLLFGPTHSLLGGTGQAAPQRATDVGPQTVVWLSALIFLWPWLALAAKRAHDRDKSARRVITVTLAMYIASYAPAWLLMFYPEAMALPVAAAGFDVLLFVSSIYILVVVGCLDGTPGPNRFGPSPKGKERGATSEPDAPIRGPGPAA